MLLFYSYYSYNYQTIQLHTNKGARLLSSLSCFLQDQDCIYTFSLVFPS